MKYNGNYRDTHPSKLIQIMEPPSRILHHTVVPRRTKKPGSKILFYHEVRGEQFQEHLDYLDQTYNIVSLSKLVEDIKQDQVNESDVAICFDDGRRTLYSDAFPEVKRREIQITIYVSPYTIEAGNYFWDKIHAINERRDNNQFSTAEVKKKPRQERMSVLNEEVESLDIDLERTVLNWDEISEMYGTGLVEFQSHTQTHPSLPNISTSEAEKEIITSKQVIERKLGNEVVHFSYPFGDYNDEIAEVLKRNDFESAVSTNVGSNTSNTPLLELNRIWADGVSKYLLSSLITGIWHDLTPGKKYSTL